MGRQIDGQTDKWTDCSTNEQIGCCMDRKTVRVGQKEIQLDGQIDRWTARWIDGEIKRLLDK